MVAEYDVLVVGKGNAALCAALSAREKSEKVVMLEAAPEEESGGNSRYAGGLMRTVYNSVEDLQQIMDLTQDEIAKTDFGTNTREEYYDDLFGVTQYKSDPDLAETLITNSFDTLVWMRSKGVRFVPLYWRQSTVVNGRRVFFGRVPVEVSGAGAGLVQFLDSAAVKAGIEVRYETRATELIFDGERIVGVYAQQKGKRVEIRARAVVLACGGFEANAEMRARYLGPSWDLVKVRGTRFNMGDGIKMALNVGAAPYGNWTGCHATGWDRDAPEFGDVNVGNQFQKHAYIFGLMINAEGKRFVDEGLDFHSFTYARYGREVLKQTGQFAWQVFDAKIGGEMLPTEYRTRFLTKVTADTLEELAGKLEGVDADQFLKTIAAYNAAIRADIPFQRAVKDGKCTVGIEPRKSNWAQSIDTPPYHAYAVTCGITFTFGGLRIDSKTGQVFDVTLQPIPGLFCAGEMVGGIFYHNYPAGTGLVSGAVFGRIAGRNAALAASDGALQKAS
jgi:tricarballylate dehydrogenase